MALDNQGKELSLFRKRLRLTQEEIAIRLGVSRGRYANWERGITIPYEYKQKLEALGFMKEPEQEEFIRVRATEPQLKLLVNVVYDCGINQETRETAYLELIRVLGLT